MEASHSTPSRQEPAHVLVVSNETVGGHKLLEAIEQRAARGPIRCTVVCPQNSAAAGFVIYDDTARSAARVRLELTLERLREMGIEAHGEVMDPDPYLATAGRDARMGGRRDHRLDLSVSALRRAAPRPGRAHREVVRPAGASTCVVDLREEPVRHVLVVASQTVGGPELIETLERRATSSPHRFTVILPPTGPDDETRHAGAPRADARPSCARPASKVTGYVDRSPTPSTSIRTRSRHHPADEIVISTLPSEQVALAARRPDRPGSARRPARRSSTWCPTRPRTVSRPASERGPDGIRLGRRTTPTRHTRPRRTRARASTRSCSASCFSSSRRRCCSGRSSRPTSSSASCRTSHGRRTRSSSRSSSRA